MAENDTPGRSPTVLHLLGVPAIEGADGKRHLLKNSKDALALAVVATTGTVSRAWLSSILWPNATPRDQLSSMRQRLFRLGRLAGRPLLPNLPVFQLSDGVMHDLVDLRDRRPPSPSTRGLELLQGHDVADAPDAEAWLRTAREQWRLLRCAALRSEANRCLAADQLNEAAGSCRQLVELDPWSEEAHRQLMTLLARMGDHAAALRCYEQLQSRMQDELGASPSAQTRALAREVAQGQVAHAVPSNDALRQRLRNPPVLVGRDEQMTGLSAAAAAHQVMVVSGEPGSGKSRLIGDFVVRHPGTVSVSGHWGDKAHPYAVAARLLQALFPDSSVDHRRQSLAPWVAHEFAALDPRFGVQPSAGMQPVRFGQALLKAIEGVPMVCVDDLQYVDQASVELISLIAGSESGPRWLFGLRPHEATAAIVEWLAAMEPGITRFALQPWSADDVAALLSSVQWPADQIPHWAPAVARATGGNPLFVLRSLDVVLDRCLSTDQAVPLPSSVQHLLQARLAQLSPDATRLAQVAALAGADFGPAVASEVLGQHPTLLARPWAELRDANLLRDERFVHDLIAEVARNSVPRPIAQWMHAAIASWLQREGAAPARVAPHWHEAERFEEAGRQYVRAAESARRHGRRIEESQLLMTAAESFDAANLPDERFAAELDRVAALVQCAAGEHRFAADALLLRARTSRQRLLAALAAAESYNASGEFAWVLDALPDAIAALRDAGDHGNAAIAARRLAYAMVNTGSLAEAAGLLDGLVDTVVPRLSAGEQAEFFGDYGTVLAGADRRSAAALAQQRGVDASGDAGRPSDAITGLANLGINHYFQGHLGLAAQYLEQAFNRPEHIEQSFGLGLGMRLTLGQILRDGGRFSDALNHMQTALDGFRAAGLSLWIVNAENSLAMLWLVLGQPGRAKPLLEATAPATSVPPFIRAARLLMQAKTATAMGRPAPTLIDQGLSILLEGDRPDVRFRLLAEHCRQVAPEAAVEIARGWVEEATRRELHGLAALGLARLVDARLRRGQVDEAANDAAVLVRRLAEVQPLADYVPALWTDAAWAFVAAGRIDEGRYAARRAMAWIRDATTLLPPEFRVSFLERNPDHPRLRSLVQQLGLPWIEY